MRKLTIDTCRPRHFRELVVLLTGESEAVPVEVGLEPVPLVAGIADVGHCLTVGRRIVGVPHQLQLVLAVRGGWGDTVRP